MTVKEMLSRMDSSEIDEWLEYFKIDPFGTLRDDYNAGLIASMIMNQNRQKESDKVFQPTDFMYCMKDLVPSNSDEQQIEDQISAAKAIALMFSH
jgi:hypothetical protein